MILAVKNFWKEFGSGKGNTVENYQAACFAGSSCDWDRERFTMDEGCSRAVRKFCAL